MPNIGNVFASPIPIDLGGRAFRLQPLSISDIGEVAYWARAKRARVTLQTLGDVLTADERKELIKSLQNPATTVDSLNENELQGILGDMSAMCYILWLAARKTEPGLTLEEVEALCTIENLAQLENLAAGLVTGGPIDELVPPEAAEAASPNPGT